MENPENIDFSLEILRCISHLEIFKVCRNEYLASQEKASCNLRLYEVYAPKTIDSYTFIKPPEGYIYAFVGKYLKSHRNARFTDEYTQTLLRVSGSIVFIGLYEGEYVFFMNSADFLVIVPEEVVSQWLKDNFIRENVTVFGSMLKEFFMKHLLLLNEEDLMSSNYRIAKVNLEET